MFPKLSRDRRTLWKPSFVAYRNRHNDIPPSYLEAETRAVCLHAILMYLNRSYRLAFILGVVMDVSSREGALILDIEPATYRKRLSRARSIIKNFLASNCGLFHKSNRCRCSSILPVYLQKGRIDPDRPVFFSKDSAPQTLNQLGCYLKEMDELKKLSCIYNAMPPSHFDFVATLKAMLRNKQFSILQ